MNQAPFNREAGLKGLLNDRAEGRNNIHTIRRNGVKNQGRESIGEAVPKEKAWQSARLYSELNGI
jgi:hypothetical protein